MVTHKEKKINSKKKLYKICHCINSFVNLKIKKKKQFNSCNFSIAVRVIQQKIYHLKCLIYVIIDTTKLFLVLY